MNRPRRSRRLPKNARRRNHIRILARQNGYGLREGYLASVNLNGQRIASPTVVVTFAEY